MENAKPQNLLALAAEASHNSYSPYSKFPVGAALLTTNGKVFTGTNVENASFGLTNCAERTALFTAVAAGSRNFTAIAIVAGGQQMPYPCGACRQVLSEFCPASLRVYVASLEDISRFQEMTLGDLLPKTFKL